MSRRPVLVHLALLLLALAAAWFTFRDQLAGDAPRDEAGMVLLQAADGDVEKLVYASNGRTLRLESRRDAEGRWFEGIEIVSGSKGDESAALDGEEEEPGNEENGEGEETGMEPQSGEEPRHEIFRGGGAVEVLWSMLEPLKVMRVLGEVGDEKLEELELADSTSSLTVTIRGREHRFTLGGTAYGSADRYARGADGDVVVLPAALTRDVEAGPSRLMERRVIRATRPEVETLELSRGGKSVKIVQHDGSQPGEASWSLEGRQAASGEFQTWADKFFRLQVLAYRADEPAADHRRAEATVVVGSREHGAETLEILSVEEEEGAKSWLARSAHTRLLAELPSQLAEEICEDLDSLLP